MIRTLKMREYHYKLQNKTVKELSLVVLTLFLNLINCTNIAILSIPNNCVAAKYANLKSEIQATTTHQRGAGLRYYILVNTHSRFSVGKVWGDPKYCVCKKHKIRDASNINSTIKVSYSVECMNIMVTCTERRSWGCTWWWYEGEMKSSAELWSAGAVPSAATGSRLHELVTECGTKSDASSENIITSLWTFHQHKLPISVKFIDINSNKKCQSARKLVNDAVSLCQNDNYVTKRCSNSMQTRLNCMIKVKNSKKAKMNNLYKLRPMIQKVSKSETLQNAKNSLWRVGEGVGAMASYDYIKGIVTDNKDSDTSVKNITINQRLS